MTASGFTLFDTGIGRCGIAWSDARHRRRAAPGDASSSRPARACSGDVRSAREASAAARRAVGDRRHRRAAARRGGRPLRGRARHGRACQPFERRVYDVARTIAPGATLTYGEIAARLGDRGLARDVGQALGRNPFPLIVPCHRVLAAGGKVGGFSANGGVTTKLRLLTIEGARTSDAAHAVRRRWRRSASRSSQSAGSRAERLRVPPCQRVASCSQAGLHRRQSPCLHGRDRKPRKAHMNWISNVVRPKIRSFLAPRDRRKISGSSARRPGSSCSTRTSRPTSSSSPAPTTTCAWARRRG